MQLHFVSKAVECLKKVHMTEHNKLVRDKVVERIEKKNEQCEWYTCPPEEYPKRLLEKLVEESTELLQEFSTSADSEKLKSEFADVLEVIDALRREMGWSKTIMQPVRYKKMRSRGGFSKRIILVRS